ncbi:putative polyribonucleotide 5'-hydroxyl-kinase Clp1 [Apostichopus japonicus]|uniref:Putative polyribonucleotide 5'-hydroxyl-kinase Clp1 n=1 Tax=Stichopus japonicus TaxID=307972 RepID=A0A2G8LPP6_STIJA|nr:putative polyribonucleotide 5'-hydroxyl-kinase Clp1 [Apostichopus japonicus]
MEKPKEEKTKLDGTEYPLGRESELRFEVDNEETVEIEIKEGLAEIFGTELLLERAYKFKSGAKAAIFTWHGCIVIISFLIYILMIQMFCRLFPLSDAQMVSWKYAEAIKIITFCHFEKETFHRERFGNFAVK